MGNLQNAGAGLKKMFIASVGAVVCTVLAIIPIVNILAAIGAIVFMVMSMIGLYQAGKDIEGCKTAFTLTIVNLILSIVGALFKNGFMGTIITIAGYVLSFMVTYLVCTSVAGVLKQIGAISAAQKGETAWKVNAVCYVILILVSIVAWIPILGWLTGILGGIAVLVLSLIAGILYMMFLSQSSKALGA